MATSAAEIGARGREIYEEQIRNQVEPDLNGRFLVVDIESGDYEVDADDRQALARARERHPSGLFYLMRIGYRAAHRIGARRVFR